MACLTICSKIGIAALYLVGVILLLPGFIWIVPEKVIDIAHGHSDRPLFVPIFGPLYARGVSWLIVGMASVLVATVTESIMRCFKEHSPSAELDSAAGTLLADGTQQRRAVHSGTRTSWRRVLVESLGCVCQVAGASLILAGCIVFLPRYSSVVPPKVILGMKAPDLGNELFKAGSVAYFLGALLGIGSEAAKIRLAKSQRRSACIHIVMVVPLLLFMAASTLLFVNGFLPKHDAVLAGKLRVAGSICLLTAVVILCGMVAVEVHRSRTVQKQTQLPRPSVAVT
mmetsp:Transcript_50298/g.92976  ORF Transcript_50298/g.92976 Transcript_50298/m.92976 type:complete len:284 (+) Transcript_50298:41-892(+)